MPELPEVETTRRGLLPHLAGRRVERVLLRRPDLRWPIPHEVETLLPEQRIDGIRRRAKYLLLDTAAGSALAGETSAQAAARELFEEMGIRHDFTNERPAFTVNFPDGFDDVYLIQTPDIALSDLRLQTQEVLDANWATLPQICAVTGHTLQSATRILEKYLARTAAMSKAAILAFENSPATAFANRLQTGAEPIRSSAHKAKGNQ